MKIKNMQIRKEMFVGDLISIPIDDKFAMGVVFDAKNNRYQIEIDTNKLYNGNDEMKFGIDNDGKVTFVLENYKVNFCKPYVYKLENE